MIYSFLKLLAFLVVAYINIFYLIINFSDGNFTLPFFMMLLLIINGLAWECGRDLKRKIYNYRYVIRDCFRWKTIKRALIARYRSDNWRSF